jgi:TniQ
VPKLHGEGGQGTFGPGATLPIVPPILEDELISSWLDRTARFCGLSIQAMLLGIGASKRIELSELDLGVPRAALKPIAVLLGISVAQLASHTMTVSWPRAAGLVARGVYVPHGSRQPRLRYPATSSACFIRRWWCSRTSLFAHILRGPVPQHRLSAEGKAVVAHDLVWALTRADCRRPDRLVYQALPLAFLGGACRHV